MFNEVDADVFVNIEAIKKNYEMVTTIDFIRDEHDVIGTIIKYKRR